jgi:hypothetical protein
MGKLEGKIALVTLRGAQALGREHEQAEARRLRRVLISKI